MKIDNSEEKSLFEKIENFIENFSLFIWGQLLTTFYILFQEKKIYNHLETPSASISRPATLLISSVLIYLIIRSFSRFFFDFNAGINEFQILSYDDFLKLIFPLYFFAYFSNKIYIYLLKRESKQKINEVSLYSISLSFLIISVIIILSEVFILLGSRYEFVRYLYWDRFPTFIIISIIPGLLSLRFFQKSLKRIMVDLNWKERLGQFILIFLIHVLFYSGAIFYKQLDQSSLTANFKNITFRHVEGFNMSVTKNYTDCSMVFDGILYNHSSRNLIITKQNTSLSVMVPHGHEKHVHRYQESLNGYFDTQGGIKTLKKNEHINYTLRIDTIMDFEKGSKFGSSLVLFDSKHLDTITMTFPIQMKMAK